MASPFFSGRIPQELFERIEQHVQSTGESKSQILVNALSQYLGLELPASNSSEVANIKTRLAVLESAIKEIQTGQSKSDRYQMSILDASDNTDNNVITEVISSDNTDNKIEILPTLKTVHLTGIPRKTLEDRRNKNQFPIEGNGYKVIGYAGKQSEKPFSNLWEIRLDN